MKNKWFLWAAAALPVFFSGCGLGIYNDWKNSDVKAITGAGAIAGKDYITGLTPSENSRKYFAKISGNDQPIETVSRSDDRESKSGVRFVKNGGILIPPGVTISFENKGYCMDPNLPANKEGDEFQLVPMTRLIPEDLQGMYKKVLTRVSAESARSEHMTNQHLIWALRTAGTDAAYANNLTKEQKRILDRCGEYPGKFEEFNANAKSNSKMLKELVGLADSLLNIRIGNVTYKASDLLDPDVGSKKINEHLNQLIEMGQYMPVEKTGFNFGEIQSGIYTDVRGTGPLQYRARIANSTSQPFIYYPMDYVGQVGSPTKNGAVATYAAADSTMRQRVTGGNPDDVNVIASNSDGICTEDNNKYGNEISLDYDDSDNAPSYNNVKEALDKFAEIVNGKEDKNQCNVEYVAHIYKDKDGKIRMTEPKAVNVVENGGNAMTATFNAQNGRGGLFAHSHPSGERSDKFSNFDGAQVRSTGLPLAMLDNSTGLTRVLTSDEAREHKESYSGSILTSDNVDQLIGELRYMEPKK